MTASRGASPGLIAWGHHRLPGDAPSTLQIGLLWIAAQLRGDEVWLAHGRAEPGEPTSAAPPEDSDWSRWAASGAMEGLDILPLPPDRPLVLQPERPFHLLPGANARIYVRVPVWVQVRVPGPRGSLLQEIPSLVLSDTWWGTFTEGEICYWLHIMARRAAPPEIFLPDRILCPVDLSNQAREELPVEKILLRCQHLSVFKGEGCLWSDEVKIRYKGEEVGSVLEMSGTAPPEAAGATLVSPPRTPPAKGFTARTFARIRGFPGLGMAS
jgi:hypothetical protein